jgi:hypothetical protein
MGRKVISDYPIHIQDQIAAQLYNHPSVPVAHLESNSGNEPSGAYEAEEVDSPVCINIHSIRRRLADPDGISGKAAIDGIVNAGLLPDDKAKIVKAVTFSQEQGRIEKTIITIKPSNNHGCHKLR